ncbi:flavin reductase [Methylocella sp.]|uniref:flavin reductase n=1 Tax=Methylocella sp. TaxID=1978226 RepID=UPI003783274B
MAEIDEGAAFREAMSRVASSVHVVTTDGAAGPGGLTATSMASVAADPPTLLFCVYKSSTSAERVAENGVFCVNVLGPEGREVADVFAGKGGLSLEERFRTGSWTTLSTGAPVLEGALASFDCRLVDAKEFGTHLIMIGAVEAVAFGEPGAAGVYARRGYHTL